MQQSQNHLSKVTQVQVKMDIGNVHLTFDGNANVRLR